MAVDQTAVDLWRQQSGWLLCRTTYATQAEQVAVIAAGYYCLQYGPDAAHGSPFLVLHEARESEVEFGVEGSRAFAFDSEGRRVDLVQG